VWLWSEQTYEMSTERSGSNQCAKAPQCLSSNQGFLTHVLGGIRAPVPTSSFPAKVISLIPIKRPLNKIKRWHLTAH